MWSSRLARSGGLRTGTRALASHSASTYQKWARRDCASSVTAGLHLHGAPRHVPHAQEEYDHQQHSGFVASTGKRTHAAIPCEWSRMLEELQQENQALDIEPDRPQRHKKSVRNGQEKKLGKGAVLEWVRRVEIVLHTTEQPQSAEKSERMFALLHELQNRSKPTTWRAWRKLANALRSTVGDAQLAAIAVQNDQSGMTIRKVITELKLELLRHTSESVGVADGAAPGSKSGMYLKAHRPGVQATSSAPHQISRDGDLQDNGDISKARVMALVELFHQKRMSMRHLPEGARRRKWLDMFFRINTMLPRVLLVQTSDSFSTHEALVLVRAFQTNMISMHPGVMAHLAKVLTKSAPLLQTLDMQAVSVYFAENKLSPFHNFWSALRMNLDSDNQWNALDFSGTVQYLFAFAKAGVQLSPATIGRARNSIEAKIATCQPCKPRDLATKVYEVFGEDAAIWEPLERKFAAACGSPLLTLDNLYFFLRAAALADRLSCMEKDVASAIQQRLTELLLAASSSSPSYIAADKDHVQKASLERVARVHGILHDWLGAAEENQSMRAKLLRAWRRALVRSLPATPCTFGGRGCFSCNEESNDDTLDWLAPVLGKNMLRTTGLTKHGSDKDVLHALLDDLVQEDEERRRGAFRFGSTLGLEPAEAAKHQTADDANLIRQLAWIARLSQYVREPRIGQGVRERARSFLLAIELPQRFGSIDGDHRKMDSDTAFNVMTLIHVFELRDDLCEKSKVRAWVRAALPSRASIKIPSLGMQTLCEFMVTVAHLDTRSDSLNEIGTQLWKEFEARVDELLHAMKRDPCALEMDRERVRADCAIIASVYAQLRSKQPALDPERALRFRRLHERLFSGERPLFQLDDAGRAESPSRKGLVLTFLRSHSSASQEQFSFFVDFLARNDALELVLQEEAALPQVERHFSETFADMCTRHMSALTPVQVMACLNILSGLEYEARSDIVHDCVALLTIRAAE
ncbi:hypothetical protein FVE85_9346 [Porphyridium purpureum]|uniref:Uncharacterized protein n=1 Tax=Porphyridium purpureum TaxID=35688 RepID=A0A5J4YQV3_PORPP|nr:hypothetical protein FVE85_9346 [Porphyridium purpureum]|eukprot:POR3754..scf222_8